MHADVTVIDRRRFSRTERKTMRLDVARVFVGGFVFCADWRFPVPACRRSYFAGRRRLIVEELGKVPGRSVFHFSGVYFPEGQSDHTPSVVTRKTSRAKTLYRTGKF